MRSLLWPLSLAIGLAGLGGTASLAGPTGARRALTLEPQEHRPERTARADAIVREASRVLAPLLDPGASPALELTTSRETFEVDTTVRADFAEGKLLALDLELDTDRARILVHETAVLQARSALGERLAPWLEEGLACCVEDAWSQGVELGAERPDPDRSARARGELRGGAPFLERLRGLGAASFERGERVHRDVALAWATARHLLHGGARARRALSRYLETLHASRDASLAERALDRSYAPLELERAVSLGTR